MSGRTPNLADLGEQAWAERHERRPDELKGWETEPQLGHTAYTCDGCGRAWNYPEQHQCSCGSSIVKTTMVDPTPLELTASHRIRRALGLERLDPTPAPLSEPLRAALKDVVPAAENLAAILERVEIAIGTQDTTGWGEGDFRWLGRLQLGAGASRGGDVSVESLSLPLASPLRGLIQLAGQARPEAKP